MQPSGNMQQAPPPMQPQHGQYGQQASYSAAQQATYPATQPQQQHLHALSQLSHLPPALQQQVNTQHMSPSMQQQMLQIQQKRMLQLKQQQKQAQN